MPAQMAPSNALTVRSAIARVPTAIINAIPSAPSGHAPGRSLPGFFDSIEYILYYTGMLKFIVDFEKDIWNWRRIFGAERNLYPIDRLSEGDREFISEAKKIDNAIDADHAFLDFIQKKYSSGMRVDLFAIVAKNEWDLVEEKILKQFEQITQKQYKFRNESISVFITTAPLCPYNVKERWIMLFPAGTIGYVRTAIAHELFHFHFHEYYEQILLDRGVSKENFQIIKEALTFLLNEDEFKDLITVPDKGYDAHRQIRDQLQEIWRKNRDFDQLVEDAVGLVI